MQVKKQQLEADMEQRTGSKLGKEYVKAVYCHAAYLIICREKTLESPLNCREIKPVNPKGDQP